LGLTRNLDGVWRETFVERNATAEEISQRTQQQASEMRFTRNRLLSDTDYTQLPDCVLPQEKIQEFSVYRKALRDVTKLPGFPWSFDFPNAPTHEVLP
jgi:hypothetical protein